LYDEYDRAGRLRDKRRGGKPSCLMSLGEIPPHEGLAEGRLPGRHNGASTNEHERIHLKSFAAIKRLGKLSGITRMHAVGVHILDGEPHLGDTTRRENAPVQPGGPDDSGDRKTHIVGIR
jgi:hypothetical protein